MYRQARRPRPRAILLRHSSSFAHVDAAQISGAVKTRDLEAKNLVWLLGGHVLMLELESDCCASQIRNKWTDSSSLILGHVAAIKGIQKYVVHTLIGSDCAFDINTHTKY